MAEGINLPNATDPTIPLRLRPLAGRIGAPGQAWVRWVDAGEVVTGGGISSGISMALHLVDRFAGRDLALRTARQIEHQWAPEAPGSA